MIVGNSAINNFKKFLIGCLVRLLFEKIEKLKGFHHIFLFLFSLRVKRSTVSPNRIAKFRSADLSNEKEKHSGRPFEVEDDLIKAIIDTNFSYTVISNWNSKKVLQKKS